MILELSYRRAIKHGSIVDFKDYMNKYDEQNDKYSLLEGSPKLINVEGTYVELVDLPLIIAKKYQYLLATQYTITFSYNVVLKWKRDSDGRLL